MDWLRLLLSVDDLIIQIVPKNTVIMIAAETQIKTNDRLSFRVIFIAAIMFLICNFVYVASPRQKDEGSNRMRDFRSRTTDAQCSKSGPHQPRLTTFG